jgi:hypothetical protein
MVACKAFPFLRFSLTIVPSRSKSESCQVEVEGAQLVWQVLAWTVAKLDREVTWTGSGLVRFTN